MAVFATHVVLMRDFQAVRFAPGDDLPEWAAGMVGSHCLVPEADPEPDAGPAEAGSDGADDEDQDSEADDAEAEVPTTPSEAAPDFTGAAPAPRRGRPRKQ